MAYIGYDQKSVGGMQLAEALAALKDVAARMHTLAQWIGEISPQNLESNTDFKVDAGQGQGFNDTFLEIEGAVAQVLADKAEQIARLARGS